MMGNDVVWANELAGPFFLGGVESAAGIAATIVNGGESYRQRTLVDFQATDRYVWFYTEQFDWKGTGWPLVSVDSTFLNAVRAAR
jgi:hypothetical protein